MKLPKPEIPYDSWKIESDNGNCDMTNMSLHLEPEQKDGYIQGTELAKRLKDTGMSASVLDYLMEHPDEIPASWKEKTKDGYTQYIYFWGTIYRNSGDDLYVRCLCFDGGRWGQGYSWLDRDFGGNYPACVSAITSQSEPLSSSALSPLTFEQALAIVKANNCRVIQTRTITKEVEL